MTLIMLLETASPIRVRKTAETILRGGVYPEPKLTILCSHDPATVQYFRQIPGTDVVPLPQKSLGHLLAELRFQRFDVLRVFWTGEKKYRRMKFLSLRLPAGRTEIDAGDGNVFRLTWKAVIRHALFRWQHPLPTDHWELVPQPEIVPEKPKEDRGKTVKASVDSYPGEKVLIVQSAEPHYILPALERLRQRPLFRNPRYTIFCRNRPEYAELFRRNPLIQEVRTHNETQQSWQHLREMRRERFDGLIVFFTGDPSYWKIKYFAFLLGARHKLIFNEHCDCFFFSLGAWLRFLFHRMGEWSRLRGEPGWFNKIYPWPLLVVKFLVFPFRFAWLLLVWLKLRMAG